MSHYLVNDPDPWLCRRNIYKWVAEMKKNKQARSGPARVEKMNLETKKFGDRSKMGLKIF